MTHAVEGVEPRLHAGHFAHAFHQLLGSTRRAGGEVFPRLERFLAAAHQQQLRGVPGQAFGEAVLLIEDGAVTPPQRRTGRCVETELLRAGQQRVQGQQAAIGMPPERLVRAIDG